MAIKDIEPEAPEEQPPIADSKKRKSAIGEIQVDLTLPEPPSKKARRLLKKGKTLPVKPASSDDEGDKADDDGKADDKKKKKERSPHGVWIGNLRFSMTRNELRKWFVDNSGGTITDDAITRVHMPMTKPAAGGPKKTPENRGFAYVDFATFEANIAAIALSETELNGRKVLIKDSKSYEGRPEKKEPAIVDATGESSGKATAEPASASTKIFVGNLSFTTTEDDLHALFEKCGKIRWIKVATFEDTGKCKGYGWVNFEEPDAAAWAVKGFVKVRETVETLEDFMDADADATPADDDAASPSSSPAPETATETAPPIPTKKKTTTPKEPPRTRTRKWWVNQLLGRTLKVELAEDDKTRYNKRFRKGGGGGGPHSEQQGAERPEGDAAAAPAGPPRKPYQKKERANNYSTDISVARLTGAAVAPQGKKVTFD
ncbi:hypothetical protein BT67DRAFT_453372 [Trichocladium antarcticum]|uniref:RRM domain-containing protein n=1 Tax=Trichocladium antarcticum TaxID=1450529 RepID=A0AAN6UTX0_9PEZI|nr:hypothetical protein BT67DRAFT_453372 [Trichocladium antarcticum]